MTEFVNVNQDEQGDEQERWVHLNPECPIENTSGKLVLMVPVETTPPGLNPAAFAQWHKKEDLREV